MSFFSLKVACGVCENKVGLNRYKVKNQMLGFVQIA